LIVLSFQAVILKAFLSEESHLVAMVSFARSVLFHLARRAKDKYPTL